jgi:hypothetical protein
MQDYNYNYTIVKFTLPTGDTFWAIQRPKRSWWTGEIYAQFLNKNWGWTTNLKRVYRFYNVKDAEWVVGRLKFDRSQKLKPIKIEVEKEC